MNVRALVAEFMGTFALVLIGAGAVVLSDGDNVTIAFAHWLVLTMGVTIFFIIYSGTAHKFRQRKETIL